MSENGTYTDGTEQVLYECGGTRWDDGRGEAPNKCPHCGAPIDAVRCVQPDTERESE